MQRKGLRERLTRKMIEEAFLDLVNEGGMKAATVSSICSRAQVNRSTFYRHYENQYQLLETIEQRLMREIDGREMSGFLCSPSPSNLQTCLSITTDSFRSILGNNEAFCILATKVHPGFFEKFLETRRPFIASALERQLDPVTADRVADFIVAGSSSFMRKWTCDEGREPPEDASRLVIGMCQAAIAANVGAAAR